MVINPGVHETHCCKDHGCKYGDDDCPVVLGTIKQAFPCEDCTLDKLELKESYKKVIADLEKQGKLNFQLSVTLHEAMDPKPKNEKEWY